MIDPKINICSKPALSAQPESLIKNNAAITTIADSAVQTRAYELYELGGKIDGRGEQDWYQAENDLRTSSQQSVVDKNVVRTSY
jgi:Protein of unknown function (DUF2934)